METATTHQLILIVKDPNSIGWQEAMDELEAREIKQGDDDDTPQHRGGIRPQHQPLV